MQISAYPHEAVVAIGKALGDVTRVRVLALLIQAGELCGCEVEATLEISQTRASRALTALRRAGLIEGRRDGAWVHYSVPARPPEPVRGLLRSLRATLGEDPALAEDFGRLERRTC